MPRHSGALGVAAMVGACTIWGLSPIYYKLLSHVAPAEILAHRTLWSLVFFSVILLAQGRLREVPRAISSPGRATLIALGALAIATNWFFFIFAVQVDRVTETSLGYYIFPLVSVLFGAVLYRERLTGAQWSAVALAAAAVVVLTVGLGVAPWISLTLAVTFGIYGAIKKRVPDGPVASVTAEVLILAPIAVAWLALAGKADLDFRTLGLLVLSGPLTATPLILFSYASRRIAMATVGLLQYLNPTLQFFCAVAIFGEDWTTPHAIAFPMIWAALALYSVAALRRPSIRASTSSTG